jgi:hypothetical protein
MRQSRGIKVLSTFDDIVNRRNDMKEKFLILAISIVYAVMLALYYTS